MKNKWKLFKGVALGILAIMLITFAPKLSVTAYAEGYQIKRLSGADRYDTAISIANEYNSGQLQNVVIATADDFPDALSGAVLASKVNAPILLMGNDAAKNKKTFDFIVNRVNKNGTIYIFGGSGVVRQDVVDYLKANGFANFVRLGGKDRYETNTLINANLSVAVNTPVVIVTGNDFPDALSISSIAAMKGYPIIMSQSNTLSPSAKAMISAIQPSKVYFIGGEGVLGKQVVNDVKSTLPNIGDNLVRLSGSDRYATSLAICNYFNMDTTNAVIATGNDFPDGLTGSVLASKLNSPILLMDESSFSKQNVYIFGKNIGNIYLLGGTGVISQKIENCFTQPEKGFDCATAKTYDDAKKLKDAGFSFAARYYFQNSPSIPSWKNNLTNQEAKDLTRAGLKIVVVYQDGGKTASYFTRNQGVSDCRIAINNANVVGQPANTPIYFAVDYDASASELANIEAYFGGIKDVLANEANNKYTFGVYGSYSVTNYIYNKFGKATFVWQTKAWSNNQIIQNFNLYQGDVNQSVSGYNVDIDKANVTNGNNIGSFTVQ